MTRELNEPWQGLLSEGGFHAVFALQEHRSTGNPLDTDASLWISDDSACDSPQSAVEDGLSVVNHFDEWVDGANGSRRLTTRARPHDRMESIPHMRRRGGESEEAFVARLIQHGEDDSYFATRATRAEMQHDGALRHAEWLPTEDSFHPILCQEG